MDTLQLSEYQGAPFSKQAQYLKFKQLQQESIPQPLIPKQMLNHLAPLETQNLFTVFMQTLKVKLELSQKL